MKRRERRKQAAAAALLLAAAVGIAAYAVMEDRKPARTELGADVPGQSAYGLVTYEGKTYKYNEHLSNFLFLGIDTREKAETEVGKADAGQADAVFLVSWDRVKNHTSLISIPRDTITEIEAFSRDGKSLGKSKDHISLAYAYGDGGHKSCQLAKTAVSNLMYGLPIQGYCSINLDGLPLLAEAVGGVTVTVPDDSLVKAEPEWTAGTEIRLDKENTETFVRYRDNETSQSALSRLARQQVFLAAYAGKAKEIYQNDSSAATELYQAMEDYMVTNIGNDQFAKLLEEISGQDSAESRTIPGEGREGESFDEYHADDSELYRMIIELFYEEAEQG